MGLRAVSYIQPSSLDLNNYGPNNPLYIAHRGSAALYPEESSVAYNRSLADGQIALECDVQTLSDGALGLMHDSTVDRTTTGTGNVSSFSASTFAALTLDSSAWLGSNYGDTLNPLLFQAWVDSYKARAILVPEDKDFLSMTALVRALINSGVGFNQALVQCFQASNLATAVGAGYQTIGLSTANSPTPAAIAATGAQWGGFDYSNETVSQFTAVGLKAIAYTVDRRSVRDQLLAQGASGFFTDDPTYLRANAALSNTDFFVRQTWAPGMLGSLGVNDFTTRGNFSAPNYWGYSSSAAGYMGCLMGFLCPVANPNNFTFTFNATEDGFNVGGSWIGIFIGTSDTPYQNGSEASSGYHLLIRPVNGQLQIYRKDSGQVAAQIATTTGVGATGGAEYTYQITVTPTALTLARISGSNQFSVAVNDATYRGAYLQIGRDGISCRLRSLQVS